MTTMDFNHVAAAWGRWWPIHERGSRSVSERLVELARIGPGSNVLDLATGVGEPAITAAKAVAPSGRILGIDLSPVMVSLARERANREGIINAEFVEADAAAYPGEHRFDAILSRWGLMFMPDLDATLAHYRKRLRDGGRFAAATWGAPPEVPMISLPMALAAQRFELQSPPLQGGPFALHDSAALRDRFIAHGYQEVEVQDLLTTFPFTSPAAYFEFMADVAPPLIALLKQLDGAQIAELRTEIERVITARFSSEDGEIRIPNRVIVIGATSRT